MSHYCLIPLKANFDSDSHKQQYQNFIHLEANVLNCIIINILQSLLHINRSHIYNWFRIHECTIYLSGNNSRFTIFAHPRLLIFSDACFYNFNLLWKFCEEVHLIILIYSSTSSIPSTPMISCFPRTTTCFVFFAGSAT